MNPTCEPRGDVLLQNVVRLTDVMSAWALARRVARFLREHYAAQLVVLFGPLLEQVRFTAYSDVDLAVWGIPWPAYLPTLGDVLDLGDEITIDLVDVTCCHTQLRDVIEREGVEL